MELVWLSNMITRKCGCNLNKHDLTLLLAQISILGGMPILAKLTLPPNLKVAGFKKSNCKPYNLLADPYQQKQDLINIF